MITAHLRNTDEVRRKLSGAYAKVLKGVEKTVARETLNLLSVVKQKLSDDVLHVRTGRLRRSVTAKFEGEGSGRFTGIVGTNVKYARAHEFGMNGNVRVPQHGVKEFKRMQTMAFGVMMKNPREVTVRAHVVKAHTVKMNLKARPFMRPSLVENTDRITGNIRKALTEAIR